MKNAYSIRPINTGFQVLDKGLYATFRDGIGTKIEHPVFAFLIEGAGKRILVDTGMSSTYRSQKYHHEGSQNKGQAIHDQLKKINVHPDTIEMIIFTHLHWDHCSNMKEFKNAEYYCSDVEYEFAMNPIPPYWVSYEHPSAGLTPSFKGCEFDLVHGEQEIVSGISVLPTPGHSPGHISVAVNTIKGSYVIVGDLFFVRENLLPNQKNGWPMTPVGRFCNLIDLWHSMELVVSHADYILMTHDPTQLEVKVYPSSNEGK